MHAFLRYSTYLYLLVLCILLWFSVSICHCSSGKTRRIRRPHLSSIFGRVGKSAKRHGVHGPSFIPTSTSTPYIPNRKSGDKNIVANQIPHEERERRIADDAASNLSKVSITADINTSASALPEFRVPVAPPRNRNRTDRALSLTYFPQNATKSWFHFFQKSSTSAAYVLWCDVIIM